MATIFWGGIALLVFGAWWLSQGNFPMAAGMTVMGLVAESNYYLHRKGMKAKKNLEK